MSGNKYEKEFQLYDFARTQVQLSDAFLEELNAVKRENEPNGDYIAYMKFEKSTERIDERTVYGYFRVVAGLMRSDNEEEALEIVALYRGKFEVTPGEMMEDLERWVDIQVVPLLLPYARVIISDTSMRMGYPPITLPTMDVLETIKRERGIHQDVDGEN